MEPSVQDWKIKSRESSWSQTEACPERLPGILPRGQGSLRGQQRSNVGLVYWAGVVWGVGGWVEEGWKHKLQEDAQLQCVPFCLMPLCLCICCSLYPECHSCFQHLTHLSSYNPQCSRVLPLWFPPSLSPSCHLLSCAHFVSSTQQA